MDTRLWFPEAVGTVFPVSGVCQFTIPGDYPSARRVHSAARVFEETMVVA